MVQVPFMMAAVVTAAIILAAPAAARAQTSSAPEISVTEAAGAFRVAASFTVAAPPTAVAAVLTDYERIPDFMPDVKSSHVLERTQSGLIVEQEAAATFMMFTKRIHLVLDISEDRGTIRFRDRCGKSFSQYEGAWHLRPNDAGTTVTYELIAKPLFDVPGFLLKRLLKREAASMTDRLKAEITSRGETGKRNRAQ